jgi:hypothetical protein
MPQRWIQFALSVLTLIFESADSRNSLSAKILDQNNVLV